MRHLTATIQASAFILIAFLVITMFILILAPAEAHADLDWWEGDQLNADSSALDVSWLSAWWDTTFPYGWDILFGWIRK